MKSKKQQKTQHQQAQQGINISTNTNNFDDKEKTAFEKMEHEVKYNIFNVLYVLLKDDDNSSWHEIALSQLDFLEIFYFSFTSITQFPWKSDEAYDIVVVVLEFIQINYWYEKLDYTTFLVFFYIVAFIIVLVILDILYVSYSFQKKRFRFIWPLQALRSVVSLFVTGLFVPVLETFTIVIDCQPQEDDKHHHSLFPEVICYEGVHIIHSAISIVISIVFMLICLIVSLTYFDASSQSKDLQARVNARADVYLVFLKIIGTYLFLWIGGPQYQWLLIFLLLVISYYAFASFYFHWPYYNDNVNKYFMIETGIFLWINCCLLVAKILEYTDFSGALQLVFLGIPLIIGIVIFGKDRRTSLLLKNINNFQTGEELSLQIRYYLQLVDTKATNRRNAIILKGYIHQHEESCTAIDCHLKSYKNSIYQTNKSNNNMSQDKRVKVLQSQNRDQYLYLHAQSMFKEGLKRFPSCTALQIQYAFFLQECMGKKKEGLIEFAKAMNFNPSFDEEFIIYRQLKMSEDFGDSDGQQEESGNSLDIVGKLAYESSLRQFQQNIERSARIHYEFWNMLSEDRPDMRKLNHQGSRINNSIAAVEQFWHQLQKLNADQPEALKLYAKFLIDILNDKEGGSELLSRAQNAMQNKKNHFESGNEVESEIAQLSQMGSACIYVQGASENLGLITQCNASAQKLFGFSSGEIVNHHMAKLMPEVYTKTHNKILQNALQKGYDNIPKKERFVFARHKSGFIFPVWISIKLIESLQSGLQFVAVFQIDKKLMNSDVGFLLVNRDKKISGISASCMKIFDYDLSKLKKLAHSGYEISKFAPELFNSSTNEQALSSKYGQNILFLIPSVDPKNFTRSNSNRTNNKSDNITEDKSVTSHYSKQKIRHQTSLSQQPKRKMTLSCQLTTINMCEYEEIGWYIKIQRPQEVIDQNKAAIKEKNKIAKERIRQPLFQFRFENASGKFIRELRNPYEQNDGMRNPLFAKGFYTSTEVDGIFNRVTPHKTDQTYVRNLDGDNDVVDPNEVIIQEKTKVQVDNNKLELFEQKKLWGKNIQTYILKNGKFVHRDSEEEQKRMQEFERQKNKQLAEKEDMQQSVTIFKNTLKSRKGLQNALNEQKVPVALRNLQIIMNIIIIGIMTLGIAEFATNNMQYNQINDNFKTIEDSYTRISEFQRIAYDVRTIILINEKKLTQTQNYTTNPDFTQYLLSDIDDALDNLFILQNNIMMAQATNQNEQNKLLGTQSVQMQFLTGDNSLKTLSFTLNEAVQQMASASFSLRHLDIQLIKETQEDAFFLTYNTYNDFLKAMRQSSYYYVEDQKDMIEHKFKLVLTLFLISLGCLFISITILIPVIRYVNQTRSVILSLLIDIPNSNIAQLQTQCEKFLDFLETNVEGDNAQEEAEQESENGKTDHADDQWTVVTPQRGINKIPKNLKLSYKKFVIQVILASTVVIAYYSTMFALNIDYVNDIRSITSEMTILGQAEQYFLMSQNAIRENMYNSTKPILSSNSFSITLDTIEQLYRLNYEIMEEQFSNKDVNEANFNDLFNNVYHGNLCENEDSLINFSLIPFNCQTMYSGAVLQGLQSVIVRYIETLKKLVKDMLLYKDKGFKVQNLFNSDYFVELFILHFRVIKDSFRKLQSTLSQSIEDNYTSKLNIRIIMFIIFLAFIILGYIFVWIPYVKQLKKEIWRTKQMLTIIPIEVIKKLPKIQAYIFNESIVTKQQNKNDIGKESLVSAHSKEK